MDLFKLLGTIAIENSDANKALDETSEKGTQAESKLGKAFKSIGKGAVAVGTTIAAGMVAGGTAVAGIVTKSVQAYAQYEQLVGGVDTLFKESSAKVQEYAANAFSTAGMSSNEYMETVTSFSASLLQSLEGDTEKAADYAHRAITDMSDNANKMGTSMEMIQNAYNGFAKQNYTMLDNLKLGYGGTKEEMARLIEDASKLTDVQKELGITVDANSMSFGNIVNAISVMQKQMDIAGTTSKEASSTISGSLSSVKASWQNLLVAVSADDLPFDTYVNNFVDSVTTMAGNMLPRIETALNGVGQLIERLAPVIIERLPALAEQVLPSLVSAAASLLVSLATVLPDLALVLVQQIPNIISTIRTELEAQFPQLEESFEFIEQIFTGVWESMQIVWDSIGRPIFDKLVELFSSVKDAVSPVVDAFKDFVIEGDFVTVAMEGTKVACDFLVDTFIALVDGVKSAVEWGTEHKTLLGVLAGVMGTLTAAIIANNAAKAIQNAGGIAEIAQLAVLQVQIWGLTAAETAHSVASTIAATATTAFGAAMAFLTSPITLVVAAIAALIAIVVLCVKYWDEIKAAAVKAWEWIKEAWGNVANWFNESVILPIAQLFTDLWNGIVLAFTTAWDEIVLFFTTIGTWIYDNVIAPIAQFFTDLWNGIVNAFHTVIDPWIEIIKRAATIVYDSVIKPIADFFTGLWNGIVSGLQTAWNGIVSGLQAAWNWIVNLVSTVAGWVNTNVIQPVVNFFTGLWEGIKTGVSSAVNAVKNVFSTVAGWINEKLIAPVKNFFSNLWDSFTNGAKKAWEGVKSVFSTVASFFSRIFNTVKDKIVAVFQAGGKVFNNIKEGILSVFKTVVNGIIKGLNAVIPLPFKGLNAILDKINGLEILEIKPFSWLTWRAPIPEIPELAEGGVLERGQVGLLEGDGAEAVVPLEKNTGWLNKVAKQLHEFTITNKDDFANAMNTRAVELQQQQVSELQGLNNKIDRIIELLLQFFPDMIEALDVNMYLDGDALVAGIAPGMDTELGKIAIKKGRGR